MNHQIDTKYLGYFFDGSEAWTKKYAHFTYSVSYRLNVTEVTQFCPVKSGGNGEDCLAVSQFFEPFIKAFSFFDLVLHIDNVAYELQNIKNNYEKDVLAKAARP